MTQRIIRGDAHHAPDVLTLLSEHMPGVDVRGRYEWLYERNPHGQALTVIAYDGPTPVGVTSVFPRRVRVGKQRVFGGIGGDGYVRPSHRRRGIATAMHEASVGAMREEGLGFMFGPPEPANLRALQRAGSRVVTRVRQLVRPALLHPLSRLIGRSTSRLEPIETVRPADLLDFVESAGEDYRILPERDVAHYAWRYASSPSRVQRAFALMDGARIRAVCALERHGDEVGVVDLLAPRADLVSALWSLTRCCGPHRMRIQVNERGPFIAPLVMSGFIPRGSKPFQVFAVDEREASSLFDASGWHYTWGDGDVDMVLG